MKRKPDPKELKARLKGAQKRAELYAGYVARGDKAFTSKLELEREQIARLRAQLGLES